ncbi:MAG: J domain-containing protein [Anaerolineae bacterium]
MSQRGRDITRSVEITLEEAYHGTTRIVRLNGQRLEVKIPAGVKTGTKIRVRSKGPSLPDVEWSGDLYLKVEIQPHDIFERDGDDLYCDLTVDLYDAILGGEVYVPTLSGNLRLRLPSVTQNGRVFRLKGQGMPRLNADQQWGNLFARVLVSLPEDLTDEELDLFERLQEFRL